MQLNIINNTHLMTVKAKTFINLLFKIKMINIQTVSNIMIIRYLMIVYNVPFLQQLVSF